MPTPKRAATLALALLASFSLSAVALADDDAGRGICRDRCGFRVRSGDDSVVGVRAAVTDVRLTGADDRTWGVMLAGRGESYVSDGFGSGRATHGFAIGGGSGGFEGALDLGLAAGFRVPITADFGPFLRIGGRGWLAGNSTLYTSFLELPEGQVGLQVASGRSLLEVAGRGGPVLAGRYDPGDGGYRALGSSFEYGGHLAIHLAPLRLHGAFRRVDARRTGDGTPVDVWTGDVCLVWGLALCADVQRWQGNVALAGAFHGAASTYAGLLIGFSAE